MEFVIVNIGRNVGTRPLADEDWLAFRQDVRIVLTSCGRLVGIGSGLSEWEGVTEEFATFQAEVAQVNLRPLRWNLARLAADWGQEAIGVALSDLVEAEQRPEPFEIVGAMIVDDGV